MISAILWDNDGVLVDTEQIYFEVNRDYLRRHGIELSEDDFFAWYLNDNCGPWHLLEERGTTRQQIDSYRQERNVLHLERLNNETALLTPGLERVLDRLSGRVEMGIVTSATRQSFEAIHNKLDILRHFRFALTSETYTHSKPSPEPYLLGLEHLGRPAHECLVIEDSPRGLQAAIAAGMRCIVLRSHLTRKHTFDGAYRIVDSMDELLFEIEALL